MKKRQPKKTKALVSHSRLILAAIAKGKPQLARRIFAEFSESGLSTEALEACRKLHLESGDTEAFLQASKLLGREPTTSELKKLAMVARDKERWHSCIEVMKLIKSRKQRSGMAKELIEFLSKTTSVQPNAEHVIELVKLAEDPAFTTVLLETCAARCLVQGRFSDWLEFLTHLGRNPQPDEIEAVDKHGCLISLESLKRLPMSSARRQLAQKHRDQSIEIGDIDEAKKAAEIGGGTLGRHHVSKALEVMVANGKLEEARTAARDLLDRDLTDAELKGIFASRIKGRWSGYGRLLEGGTDADPLWRLRLTKAIAAASSDPEELDCVIREVVYNESVPTECRKIIGSACIATALTDGDNGIRIAEDIAESLGRALHGHEIDLAVMAEVMGRCPVNALWLANKYCRDLGPEAEAIILAAAEG